MLAMQDASQPFPVQADLSVGGTRAAVVGTLRDPASLAALDLRLKLSGGSMAQLYPLTGVTLPDTPPYSTDGHLVARLRRQGGAVFDYKDFNGKVGNSDLHGDVSFALGAPRPRLTGKLVQAAAHGRPGAADRRALGQGGAGPGQGQERARPAARRQGPADAGIPHRSLARHGCRCGAGSGQHHPRQQAALSDLSVHVVLQDGVLTLDPLKFGMAGGSMAATARLDGSGAPLSGRIEVHARRLRLKQLFPASPSMQKTLGELHGDLALTGSGNSVAALLGSATGDVKMLVNDGVISRSLMEIAGLNVATTSSPSCSATTR